MINIFNTKKNISQAAVVITTSQLAMTNVVRQNKKRILTNTWYQSISTPATIQMGPRRPPEHRHHRPPPPPLRSLPMAPLPRPGVCARSQAAPGDLNAHLGILSCRRRSTDTRNLENSRPREYYSPRFDSRWLGRAWLRAQVPCGRSGAIGSHLNTRGEHRHYPAGGGDFPDFHQNRHPRL